MLKDNLILLRKMRGLPQETVAEAVGISRQAYAKWEKGISVPDIERCAALADLYGVTVDSLIRSEKIDDIGVVLPSPPGKNIWGTVVMNDRGQIVIPKGARDLFELEGGQRLIVCSDEVGIALIPAKYFEEVFKKGMELLS